MTKVPSTLGNKFHMYHNNYWFKKRHGDPNPSNMGSKSLLDEIFKSSLGSKFSRHGFEFTSLQVLLMQIKTVIYIRFINSNSNNNNIVHQKCLWKKGLCFIAFDYKHQHNHAHCWGGTLHFCPVNTKLNMEIGKVNWNYIFQIK